MLSGRAVNGGAFWDVDYSASCTAALLIKAHGEKRLHLNLKVRCRKCANCLRARTNYWGYAAMNETIKAHDQGNRTWFGTLTLSPAAQAEFDLRALALWSKDHPGSEPEWWNDPKCDAKFALLRDAIVPEVQKYWKRLRKQGHRFKYFLVFERHKSGLPHMHFLLHEQEQPIRARHLQSQWPWGFSKVNIVGGSAARAAAPEKAAWYVVKYLSKSYQSKQIASRRYRPAKRGCPAH